MMNVFTAYVDFYDTLYADKNYEAECDYLETIFQKFSSQPVKEILDLGCGTGGHAIPLAQRGYQVTGIDRSEEMLEAAKIKSNQANTDVNFQRGDIQNLVLNTKYDSVLAMFAVISYQTTNDDLIAAFRTSRAHLEPEGLFIFDTWFGPSVLATRPSDRVKMIKDGTNRTIRIAKPWLDISNHIVRVDYTVLHFDGNQLEDEVEESHSMRFLFLPEVELLCQMTGFELLHYCPFMDLKSHPTEDDWNVSWILCAV